MNEELLMELVPIVAELTEKYTSGESTSVTYEKANQFMGAVAYCIEEYERESKSTLSVIDTISMKEKYKIGKELVSKKVMETRAAYKEWIINFNAFGNENLRETVTVGISGFFKYYDVLYEPQNSIITCDYPTLIPIHSSHLSGIDLIARYLKFIQLEQKLLCKMSEESILHVLSRFDKNYRNQFYNITSVVLRHILACMLIQKNIATPATKADYVYLFEQIVQIPKTDLVKKLRNSLSEFMNWFYDGDPELYEYLKHDILDFTVQLKNIKDVLYLKNVVVL